MSKVKPPKKSLAKRVANVPKSARRVVPKQEILPELLPKSIDAQSTQTQPTVAEQMAKKQREISVSEFFLKNRHLLGFDNPRKALLTTVKEAVDNSLDASEEAGILPDVTVAVEVVQTNGA